MSGCKISPLCLYMSRTKGMGNLKGKIWMEWKIVIERNPYCNGKIGNGDEYTMKNRNRLKRYIITLAAVVASAIYHEHLYGAGASAAQRFYGHCHPD